jgi:hypothetical protein
MHHSALVIEACQGWGFPRELSVTIKKPAEITARQAWSAEAAGHDKPTTEPAPAGHGPAEPAGQPTGHDMRTTEPAPSKAATPTTGQAPPSW